jgi:SAM-dependent methyltransferase
MDGDTDRLRAAGWLPVVVWEHEDPEVAAGRIAELHRARRAECKGGRVSDDVRQFWEDLYGERDQVWSGKVNAALAREAADLPPGRALDLGCGEGGDALWLAERGWQVTAVDISRTALDRAAAEAARRGIRVDWREQDLAQALPPGPYDLVTAQFLQSPVELPRADVLRRAAQEVAPGGVLLVVGHAAPPPWARAMHDPALMPSAAQVLADLDLGEEWEVVRAEEVARTATGPDGQTGELLDSVVLLRRR